MTQTPAISGEPGPGGTCRVCSSKLDESLRCGRCGAAYGESNRCPHCKSVADVEPHDILRYRCRVCGGPRVPLDAADVVRTGRERAPLALAQKSRMKSAAWKVGAISSAGFGLISLVVALLVLGLASPGFVATLLTLAIVSVPLAVAVLAWRRAKREDRTAQNAIDDAWSLVASDWMRNRDSELTADDLAHAMRISNEQAELLLARLSVQDFVQARVTDEGDLAYSTRDIPAPRARVEGEPAETELALEEEAEADLARAKTVLEERPRRP
jgi:hypothetical protein